jgi:ubiquitin carboxyl-terminal hydrolase 22/27/51
MKEASTETEKRLRKNLEKEIYIIRNLPKPSCSECDVGLVPLYACLQCVYLGCKDHIHSHTIGSNSTETKNKGHSLFVEFENMSLWCAKCSVNVGEGYIQDVDCERIFHQEKVRMASIVTQCMDPMFTRTPASNWTPNNQEMVWSGEVIMNRK